MSLLAGAVPAKLRPCNIVWRVDKQHVLNVLRQRFTVGTFAYKELPKKYVCLTWGRPIGATCSNSTCRTVHGSFFGIPKQLCNICSSIYFNSSVNYTRNHSARTCQRCFKNAMSRDWRLLIGFYQLANDKSASDGNWYSPRGNGKGKVVTCRIWNQSIDVLTRGECRSITECAPYWALNDVRRR